MTRLCKQTWRAESGNILDVSDDDYELPNFSINLINYKTNDSISDKEDEESILTAEEERMQLEDEDIQTFIEENRNQNIIRKPKHKRKQNCLTR